MKFALHGSEQRQRNRKRAGKVKVNKVERDGASGREGESGSPILSSKSHIGSTFSERNLSSLERI